MQSTTRTRTILAAAALAAAFALSHTSTFASPADYRAGFAGMTPAIRDWSVETLQLVEAAQAKPELACGAQMNEIARRGTYLVDDLAGMDGSVPARLAASHESLKTSISIVASAAAGACADPAAAAEIVEDEQPRFRRAFVKLSSFAGGAFGGRGG